MISITQRMKDNCCGTTCSKVEIAKAIHALESTCEELATCQPLYIKYRPGDAVLRLKRRCTVLNHGHSFVALAFPDGHIEVAHQDELTAAEGRLP